MISVQNISEELESNHMKIKNMVAAGLLPEPDEWGKYTHQTAEELKQKYRALDLHNKTDVCRLAGVDIKFYIRAIRNNLIEPPEIKVGRRQYYNKQQAAETIEKLQNLYLPEASESHLAKHQKRRDAGYFSGTEVSDLLGGSKIIVEYGIRCGRFAKPTHRLEGFSGRFYIANEIEEMKKQYARYNEEKIGKTYLTKIRRKRAEPIEIDDAKYFCNNKIAIRFSDETEFVFAAENLSYWEVQFGLN